MVRFEELLDVPGFSASHAREARARLDALAKPPGSLGRLEVLATRLAGTGRTARPTVQNPRVLVFAGEHGVAAKGVSAYPAAVTPLMVSTIESGRACVSAIARSQGASVELVDAGLGDRAVADISEQPAMTKERAIEALLVGAEAATRAHADGVDLLAIGELGIANTTPASALAAALLDVDAKTVVGPGTGIDAEGIENKRDVVTRALRRSADARKEGALATLAEVGGAELAAAAGCMLQAARLGIPVLLDGFIIGSSALAARALAPQWAEHAIFATASAEPGHVLLRAMFPQPDALLALGLRLGEGSGAALAIGVARAACSLLDGVALLSEVVPAEGAP